MRTYWGIDLGGTKIEGAVLSAPSPDAVLVRRRLDTEAPKGYQHIIDQIVRLVNQMKEETGLVPERIGFGTPGTFDPRLKTMKGSNTTCLNGMPLPQDLEKALGVPVALANDANCFALAEATLGAVPEVVPDYRCVFGVIMGTGVGGGLIFRGADGQPFVQNGLQGIGGEWGHNILEEGGYDCYCGKKGCNEQVLSGPALQKFYREQSGEDRKLKEIVDRHKAGIDPHATATVERMLEYFGRSISTLINVLDPDAIVLGGGVGNVDLLYTEGVERIKKYIFNNGVVDTHILRPKLGDSAGVFGAAML
ncbi:ROK family protein [Tellurirhabdus rosea]|uniref:ROK family protein n=1 Tax=Tellurirhabdus rosea TaxID=2674997 RepID=UPI00224CC264|nr:ROK family protein [Tellurirhabdus rosea]